MSRGRDLNSWLLGWRLHYGLLAVSFDVFLRHSHCGMKGWVMLYADSKLRLALYRGTRKYGLWLSTVCVFELQSMWCRPAKKCSFKEAAFFLLLYYKSWKLNLKNDHCSEYFRVWNVLRCFFQPHTHTRFFLVALQVLTCHRQVFE